MDNNHINFPGFYSFSSFLDLYPHHHQHTHAPSNCIFNLGSGSCGHRRIQGVFTARKRSLGQGNVFTGVCDSVNRGVHGPGGVCAWFGGVHGPGGVVHGPGGGAWWAWAVRILLECILV